MIELMHRLILVAAVLIAPLIKAAIPWQPRISGTTGYIQGVAYGNGTWLAVASDVEFPMSHRQILTSSDSVSWKVTAFTDTSPHYPSKLAFGAGVFAVTYETTSEFGVQTSSDGVQWTTHSLGERILGLITIQGRLVASGELHEFTSVNGQTWVQSERRSSGIIQAAFGNGTYVASAYDMYASSDGANWTPVPNGPWAPRGVSFGAGRFVAVTGSGAPGAIVTSTDGTRWTNVLKPEQSNYLTAIEYADGHFVVTGYDAYLGFILTSADGLSWDLVNAPDSVLAVACNDGLWVAAGARGLLWSSASTLADSSIPRVTKAPVGVTAKFGDTVTLAVEAAGTGFSYQWYRNGNTSWPRRKPAWPVTTASTLTIKDFSMDDIGVFTVVVRNSTGAVITAPFMLTTGDPSLPVFVESESGDYLRSSYPTGGSFSINAIAVGIGTLRYQWYHDGVPIPGATDQSYGASLIQSYDAGAYWASVSNENGTVTTAPQTLVVETPPSSATPPRFSNASIRASIGSAPLIVGFAVAGGTLPILGRAAGPSLSGFQVTGFVADPILTMFDSSNSVVASNDNWNTDPKARSPSYFVDLGAFWYTSNLDSALTADVSGVRSLHATGKTGGGVVLLELYDASKPRINARLVNLSARTFAGTGDKTLIMGFAVEGTGPKLVLLRAIGPKLAEFGIVNPLPDPVLTISSRWGSVSLGSVSQDNWETFADQALLAKATQATGAFPLGTSARESAMVLWLPPGVYTATVSGHGQETGEALVEMYEVP